MCFICNVKYVDCNGIEANQKLVVPASGFTDVMKKIEDAYYNSLLSVNISWLSDNGYIYLPEDEAVIESIRKENEI